ncbi:MAG: hypothetical protein MI864_08425, partial [Pseudomonadales bacterium]|nr:hypothetical protein [Pseudomonadales bacterium]
DFNTFPFAPAIKEIKDAGYSNLIEKVAANDQYTFIFVGNAQVLDHILVPNALNDGAEVDIIHVNSEFANPMNDVRASDHDPVLARVKVL